MVHTGTGLGFIGYDVGVVASEEFVDAGSVASADVPRVNLWASMGGGRLRGCCPCMDGGGRVGAIQVSRWDGPLASRRAGGQAPGRWDLRQMHT